MLSISLNFALWHFYEKKRKSRGHIESYRDNGKPAHKTLHSLGKIDDYSPDQLKRIFALDAEKIAEASRYDGLIAIATNNKDLSETELLDNYRHLYRVEHSFRRFKTHLETRPIFHWTDIRIRGHLCLCYIAYALNNQILYELRQAKEALSENELRSALDKMQASLIEQNKESFYLRANQDGNVKTIIQILKTPKSPSLTPKSKINNYLG